MPTPSKVIPLGVLIASTLLACGGDLVEPVASAVALGHVVDGSATPVSGATVRGGFCEKGTFDEWSATTDSSGRYRLEMTLFPAGQVTLCVRLIAEPPAGAGLSSDTVQVDDVVFSGAGPSAADSIQVDFQLVP